MGGIWLLISIIGAIGTFVAVQEPRLITNHLYHFLGLNSLFGE